MPSKKRLFQKIDQNLLILIVVSVVVLIGLAGAFYGQGLIGAQLPVTGPIGAPPAQGGQPTIAVKCSAEQQAVTNAATALIKAQMDFDNANMNVKMSLALLTQANTDYNNASNALTRAQRNLDLNPRDPAAQAAVDSAKKVLATASTKRDQARAAYNAILKADGPKIALAKVALDQATSDDKAAKAALKACMSKKK